MLINLSKGLFTNYLNENFTNHFLFSGQVKKMSKSHEFAKKWVKNPSLVENGNFLTWMEKKVFFREKKLVFDHLVNHEKCHSEMEDF